MKYIASTIYTKDNLPRMNQGWGIIHFFFNFRAGSGIANTQLGMLRSFALQPSEGLLNEENYLPNLFAKLSLDSSTNDVLTEAICKSVKKSSLKVLAIIDGLDEYSGDLVGLTHSLLLLSDSSGIKMCVASRPEGEFESAFQTFPTIQMQDYNDSGIKSYMQTAISLRRFNFKTKFSELLQ